MTIEFKGNLVADSELYKYKDDTILACDIAYNDDNCTLYFHATRKFKDIDVANKISSKLKKGTYVFVRGQYTEVTKEVKDKKSKEVKKFVNRNIYITDIFTI